MQVDNKGIFGGYEKVRKSVSSQEPEMQTCGLKKLEESHELVAEVS